MSGHERSGRDAGGKTVIEGARERLPQRWALWRLDDNGNRFLMETFDVRGYAEAAVRDYSARGHKQVYWVEPA